MNGTYIDSQTERTEVKQHVPTSVYSGETYILYSQIYIDVDMN